MTYLSPTSTLADVERLYILSTLRLCEGNRTQTAKVLNVSLRCLRNKLREYKSAGHEISDGKAGRHGHTPGVNPFIADLPATPTSSVLTSSSVECRKRNKQSADVYGESERFVRCLLNPRAGDALKIIDCYRKHVALNAERSDDGP
jgi:hypothetical protein